MKIDNIDFNKGFVEGFATEVDFLTEMEGEGYKDAIYHGDKKRSEKLKRVYQLHHPKKDKPIKPSKG